MRRLILAFTALMTLNACQHEAAAPLAPQADTFLFSSQHRCSDARDCITGLCQFSQCVGLLEVDEPWKLQAILTQARAQLGSDAETQLFDALVQRAAHESLVTRARLGQALAHLKHPQVKATLATWHQEARGPLRELLVLARAQAGDADVLEELLEIAEREHSYQVSVALRLLGTLKQEPALEPLLSYLSPELEPELLRSAIAGLKELGDLRAISPLRELLVVAPEALSHDITQAMATILASHHPEKRDALKRLGADARAWDEALRAYDVPEAPVVPLRTHQSESDLDLPTP